MLEADAVLLAPGASEATRAHDSSGSAPKIKQLIELNRRIARKRKKFGQIFYPIITNVIVISMLRSLSPDHTYPASRALTVYDPVKGCVASDGAIVLVYCDSPEDSHCEDIFSSFTSSLSEAGLTTQSYRQIDTFRGDLLANPNALGVEFSQNPNSTWTIQVDVSEQLYATLSPYQRSDGTTCRIHGDPQCAPQQFVYSCASALEVAASRAISEHTSSGLSRFQIFPQPALAVSGITSSFLVWLIPMYLSGLFLNIYNFALIELVIEKESRLVDYLLAWGFSRAIHFQAWIIWNGVLGFSVAGLTSIGLVKFGVFPLSSIFSLFFGSALYFVSLLSLAYILSMWITTARSATTVASFSELIFSVTAISVGSIKNLGISILFAIVPTVPFFLLIQALAYAESPRVVNPGLGVSGTLLMSLIVAVVMVFVTLWKSGFVKGKKFGGRNMDSDRRDTVLEIRGLVKQYPKTDSPALKGVDLVVAEGVTTIIGGNGAGKSTLINSILRCVEIDSAQKFCVPENACIGVCFQEDTFWAGLTVEEHLEFFLIDVCGLDRTLLLRYVSIFGLTEVLSNDPTTLSGGQKRRLSSILAFARSELGSTQLLILDEPTTGIDVAGRRLIWDQIRAAKSRGKSVLLTTHYLDEAAELSDQIVFLEQGEVARTGSVIELRGGYIAQWEMGEEPLENILRELAEIAPELHVDENSLRLHVPATGIDIPNLIMFFEVCESHDRIKNFSFQSVSLETLFDKPRTADSVVDHSADEFRVTPHTNATTAMTRQMECMATIRIKSVVHNFGSFFATIVFPVLFLGVSMGLRSVFTGSVVPSAFGVQSFTVDAFSDGFNATSGQVPVIGEFDPSLISPYEPLMVPEGTAMIDFLFEADQWYPFAIDAEEGMVWLNPANPRSGVPLTQLITGGEHIQWTIASSMSTTEYTARVLDTLTSFSIYELVLLVSMATQVGAMLFDEKSTMIKRLVELQGMGSLTYWLGSGLGHLIINSPVIVLAFPVMVLWVAGDVVIGVPGAIGLLWFAAVVNAVQVVIAGYLFVYFFTTKEDMLKNTSYYLIGFVLVFAGTINSVVGTGLDRSGFFGLISTFCDPFGTLPTTVMHIAHLELTACSIVSRECDWGGRNTLWHTGAFGPVFGGIIQILFMLLLIWRVEQRRRTQAISESIWLMQQDRPLAVPAHESVLAERSRIFNSCSDDILFVKLWHAFPRTFQGWQRLFSFQVPEKENPIIPEIKWVLNDFTVGVPKNAIVGLIGENGAGKSTAISILLGAISPVGGYAGLTPGRRVGFCPQTHALWLKVSGAEHIRFYGALRGQVEEDFVSRILNRVGIPADHHEKQVRHYSGGMKRRLAIAIALIGEPEVLILDEPTAGVDIAGKREIWDIIKQATSSQDLSVLLTTHSLEEADNMCTRICIMSEGRLIRVGTTGELKSGNRRIIVSLEAQPSFSPNSFIIQVGRNQVKHIVDTAENHKFQVALNNVRLSLVFQTLVDLQKANRIKQFSLTAPSLEDVFLGTIGKTNETSS
jgi:ABC-type multidrug transport system ATPase subunit